MLRATCLLHFILTGLTGFFYLHLPQLAPGINAHGLIGVLGFGYAAFLHFLVTPTRYGPKSRGLRSLLAVASLLLVAGALLADQLLLNLAAAAFLPLSGLLALWFTPGANRREDLFLRSAAIIAFLSWVYFTYSLNFTSLGPLECRFSHILLAFSFPLSLLLFSRYVDLLSISDRQVRQTAAVLVGGVMLMFAGLLAGLVWLETASALVLLLLITLYLIRAFKVKNTVLVIAFAGLLLTGLSGVAYVLAYGNQHAALILIYHAHLAHLTWGAYGIFYLLMLNAGFSRGRQLFFLLLLLASLVVLLPWMIFQSPGLLILAILLFFASGLCLPTTLLGSGQATGGASDKL